MRANIDEKAINDPRFRRLARMLEWPHVDFAIGAAARVWLAALNRVSESNPDGCLSRDDAEDATDHRGLIGAMLASGLAEERASGIYFHGVRERGSFLLHQRANGKKGGRPKKKKPTGYENETRTPSKPNPETVETKAYSPDLDPDLALVPDPKTKSADKPRTFALEHPKPKRAPVRGYSECVDAFHASYVKRTGAVPTWEDKQHGMLRRLVAAHGSVEVLRRIAVLFAAPPAFLAASVPDVATLAQHFDKLAAPAQPRPVGHGPAPTTSTPARPVQPYTPPLVADPVPGDAIRALASGVLATLRKNGT